MALDPVLQQELRKEIEAEVAAICSQAEAQGDELLAEAEKAAQADADKAARRLEEEVQRRRRRALAAAELEERNRLLGVRRQEVDRVIQEAAAALRELQEQGDPAYRKLMARVCESCRRLLPAGELQVRLGPGLKELGRELEEQGLMVTTDERLFGLVVETSDGRQRCDGSVPRLLAQLRREREVQLEALLFGEES